MTSLEKWRGLAQNLIIRAYDPSTKVSIMVAPSAHGNEGIIIRYNILDAVDTTNQEMRLHPTFHFSVKVLGWPGDRVAAEVILGGWVLLSTHEAMELVTFRTPNTGRRPVFYRTDGQYFPAPCYDSEFRVNDPHYHQSRNYTDINSVTYNNDGPLLLRYIYDKSVEEVTECYSDACLTHLDELEESYG